MRNSALLLLLSTVLSHPSDLDFVSVAILNSIGHPRTIQYHQCEVISTSNLPQLIYHRSAAEVKDQKSAPSILVLNYSFLEQK
jgi:hypothetical protein